jgi:hypothetical protein
MRGMKHNLYLSIPKSRIVKMGRNSYFGVNNSRATPADPQLCLAWSIVIAPQVEVGIGTEIF